MLFAVKSLASLPSEHKNAVKYKSCYYVDHQTLFHQSSLTSCSFLVDVCHNWIFDWKTSSDHRAAVQLKTLSTFFMDSYMDLLDLFISFLFISSQQWCLKCWPHVQHKYIYSIYFPFVDCSNTSECFFTFHLPHSWSLHVHYCQIHV